MVARPRWSLAVAGAVGLATFGAVVRHRSAPTTVSLATTKWTTAVGEAQAAALEAFEADSSYTTVTVTIDDLLDIDEVCRWVTNELGTSDCRDDMETVEGYLPTKMEFKVKDALVEQSVGSQAKQGHVVFNLAAYSGGPNTILASWMIVADYGGNIKTMVPMKYEKELYRNFGLKMWNDAELIVSAGKEGKLRGPAFTFDWATGAIAALVDTNFDIHDVQRARYGDKIWTLGSDLTYQELDVASGSTLSSTDLSETTTIADPNHLQLIEDDEYAIVSARYNNAIYKIHAATGKGVWILGGDDGVFDIAGPDGETYAAGSSYWVGQHNAEYIGNDEYAMFDNNYDEASIGGSANSRLLVVKVNESTYEANVTFQYDLDVYSDIFGDNDRLPTGNLLACYWPSDSMDYDNQFSAKIVEVVRDSSEVAFEVKITSTAMTEAECPDNVCMIKDGFFMYSVERFYEAPLVYSYGYDAKTGVVSFTTANTYKQSSRYAATWTVTAADGTVYSGNFDYKAYWRETDVDAATVKGLDGDLTLTVTNAHGTTRTVTVST